MGVEIRRNLVLVTSFLVGVALLIGISPAPAKGAEGTQAPGLVRSVSEVARANVANWSSIYGIDVQYDVHVQHVENGQLIVDRTSTGHRWQRGLNAERLVLRNVDGRERVADRLVRDGIQRELSYPTSIDIGDEPLRPCDDRPINATISPAAPGLLNEMALPTLEAIRFIKVAPAMRVDELLTSWDAHITSVTSDGKGGDTTYHISATYPSGQVARYAGSVVNLSINAQKGFLVEKAEILEVGAAYAVDSDDVVSVRVTWEILRWAEPRPGVWFPLEVLYRIHGNSDAPESNSEFSGRWNVTQLAINEPFRDAEWLDFAFPENAIVPEYLAGGDLGRIFVWGSGNAPSMEFGSDEEYEVYRRALCNDPATRAAFVDGAEGLQEGARRATWWRPLIIANLVAVLVIAAVMGVRHRRRSQS